MGFFSHSLDYLPKACEDIGVTVNRLHEDVETVKEWLRQQPHLPDVDSGLILENLLLRNKGSVELTKQTLEFFFTSRSVYPELFVGNDPCSIESEQCYERRKVMPLPVLTSTGHRVIIANLPIPDATLPADHMRSTLRMWGVLSDLLTEKDIACGVIYIIDNSKLSIVHSTMLLKEFPLFQKAMRCVFTGYKFRIKGIHLFQPPPLIDSLLRIIKKIFPEKVAGRMHLHPDLDSLHQHVEKAVLPKEFGGDLKPFLELAADWRQEEISQRQWVLDRAKMWKIDESKRPPDSKVPGLEDTAFGITGNFKKLEVD